MEALDAVLLATAVLLLALIVRFAEDVTKAAVLLGSILVVPLFLKITGSSIELGDALVPSGAGQSFPISVLAVMLFAWLWLLRLLRRTGRWRASPLNGPVALFIALNVFVLFVGLFEDVRTENFLFALQTVGPALCYFLAFDTVREVETVRAIAARWVVIMGGFVIALAVSSVVSIGVDRTLRDGLAWFVGPIPIYTMFDYVPLVITVAYGLGLALVLGRAARRARGLLCALVFLTGASLLLLHSRGGILTAVLVTVVELALFGRYRAGKRALGLAGSTLILVVVGVLALGSEAQTMRYLRLIFELGGKEAAVQSRLDNLARAAENIAGSPLAGSRYVVRFADQFGVGRIANPHNQYLTYGVRAGLVVLGVYVWILFLSQKRLASLVKGASTPEVRTLAIGVLSVMLGVSLVSNMLQDNFVQPYSGCVLWWLLGLGECLCAANGRARVEETPDRAVAVATA